LPKVNIICFDLAHFPDFFRKMEPYILSSEEQQRKSKFAFTHLGERFAAAHMGLRLLLARQLDNTTHWRDGELLKIAASFSFEKGHFGKPKLKSNHSLVFNLSHSGDWAALAVVNQANCFEPQEVGVDLEAIAKRSALALAKRFFSAKEWQKLYLCTDSAQQNQLFTKLWTRKEACLKLWGTGMHTSLSSFEVLSNLPKNLASKPLPCPQCLYLQSAEVIKGMYLSLALSFVPDSVDVTLIDWTNHPTTFYFLH